MSKVELIRTYLKHHDRLDVILQSAIRPYGLIAQPPARLSLFLDLSILLAWYSSVLILEMRARMDKAYQRALSDPRSNSPRSASGGGSERVVAAGAKEWLGMVEEEEFSEYLTFLASVANDAHRVYTTNLINFDDIGAQDDVLATLDVHNALDRSRYCFSFVVEEIKSFAFSQHDKALIKAIAGPRFGRSVRAGDGPKHAKIPAKDLDSKGLQGAL
eukprot:scaffold607_cov160-Ochromonas_danica.AAC.6